MPFAISQFIIIMFFSRKWCECIREMEIVHYLRATDLATLSVAESILHTFILGAFANVSLVTKSRRWNILLSIHLQEQQFNIAVCCQHNQHQHCSCPQKPRSQWCTDTFQKAGGPTWKLLLLNSYVMFLIAASWHVNVCLFSFSFCISIICCMTPS